MTRLRTSLKKKHREIREKIYITGVPGDEKKQKQKGTEKIFDNVKQE